MKRRALIAFLVLTWLVAPARATTSDPQLDYAASKIAGHPVRVLCYERGEVADRFHYDPYTVDNAWGYVLAFIHDEENMAAEVCGGALAITNSEASVPLWEQALGALTIAHESFHQRLDLGDRLNEAKTECRAIRHFTHTVRLLGGTAEKAAELYPYAAAIHYRISFKQPNKFGLRDCDVPWWWSP
jgi:hypothetical protein